jgi:hypothetical protein
MEIPNRSQWNEEERSVMSCTDVLFGLNPFRKFCLVDVEDIRVGHMRVRVKRFRWRKKKRGIEFGTD